MPLGRAAVYPSDRGVLIDSAAPSGPASTMILSVDQLDPGMQFYAQSLGERLSRISAAVQIGAAQVCGRDANILSFTGLTPPGQHATPQSGTAITVVPRGSAFAYIAVIQTPNPRDFSYLAQRQAMLSGFCVTD